MQLSWLVRGLRTGVLTTGYPRRAASMPDAWRGVIALDPDRCRVESEQPPCTAACPSAALWTEPSESGPRVLHLDALACVACGRCVPACPAGALSMTPQFELSRLDHPDRRAVG
jgi:formate hydrogenlyase subunit 6/NADH:ubiquinone oxidoreductase subunit I